MGTSESKMIVWQSEIN